MTGTVVLFLHLLCICVFLHRCWKKNVVQSYSPNEDEDVVAERLRVDRGDASADILQVKHLTKVYQNLNKRVQAVKRLSVGIPAGEVCAISILIFIMQKNIPVLKVNISWYLQPILLA